MTWDYIVHLSGCNSLEGTPRPWALVGGFVDHVTKCFLEAAVRRLEAERNNDRDGRRRAENDKSQLLSNYRQRMPARFPVKLYPGLHVNFSFLPAASWLGLQIDFELLTPWYSKDDRVFHVLDNPVRKDRVFGVPFMAASSWKGLLRWACRMQEGLRQHLEAYHGSMQGWKDPDWILHLFGNEKGEKSRFHQGALVFYPTWFDRIAFEVINPHSRARRAGTQPIYYEVVPPGAQGTLSLLYAPWPGMEPTVQPNGWLPGLLEAIETLFTTYGISAKRTVGWGTARIVMWRAFHKTHGSVGKDTRAELWQELQNWLAGGNTP